MTRGAAARLYRTFLLMAPASLRRDHAIEMEDLFLDRLASSHKDGPSRARIWLAAIGDLLRARLASWRRPDQHWTLTVPLDERKGLIDPMRSLRTE